MHRRIKVWQRQIAISMKSISKSVIEMVDLRKSYIGISKCSDIRIFRK